MLWKILIIHFVFLSYFIGIVHIPDINLNDIFTAMTQNQTTLSDNQRIGFGDSTSIQIKRTRFYGTITEKENRKVLYFIDFIPILLFANGINFIWIHVFFVIGIFVWVFFVIKKDINSQKEVWEI